MEDINEILHNAFYKEAIEEKRSVESNGWKLAHYTTASVAYDILKNKEFWLRKPKLMNDFLELEYGITLLERALTSAPGDRLKCFLNNLGFDLRETFVEILRNQLDNVKNKTYIGSFSLHKPQEDDGLGRLSMWRAYGGQNGVAIVMDPAVFGGDRDTGSIYSAPVSYLDQSGLDNRLNTIIDRLESRMDLIRSNKNVFISSLNHYFETSIISIKHPGFHEEREWRVFQNEAIDHALDSSLKCEVMVVRGLPQLVMKIQLQDSEDSAPLNPNNLIQKIIIGPSEDGATLKEALEVVLEKANIDNSKVQILVSDIPLRQ